MVEAGTTSLPEPRWYIVHTYSNFEKKVSEEIRRQAHIQGLSDLVEEVMVPTEEVIEIRRGQKHNAERKFLPGYVLVRARLTDEAYHLIKNVGKVLTHRQLLRDVWGPTSGEETHYLRVYMNQLRQKLEPEPSRPKHLLTEPGVGYRFVSEA